MYTLQYQKLIENERRISRARVKPQNVYRISVYKYELGDTKKFVGLESAYVFIIGIVNNKFHCLKLTDIKPHIFFKFINSMLADTVNPDDIDELSDFLVKTEWDGRDLYRDYVQPNKSVYGPGQDTYRTYMIDNVKYISIVNLKRNILNEVFNLKSNEQIDKLAIFKEIQDDDGSIK